MIVADTGAVVALVDANDRHHQLLRAAFEEDPLGWVLPWAILPEVDYLLLHHVGADAERLFLEDLKAGRYSVEWSGERDLARAVELNVRYTALELGLVDGVVVAVAERLRARAIATLDLRDFGAIEIAGTKARVTAVTGNAQDYSVTVTSATGNTYTVTFNRDVSKCSYTAAVNAATFAR
jgi:uncharacterized protein